MQKKLRWGVIGAGGIADRRTIPGMMLCDNVELIAVMEINKELAEKFRKKWSCKKAYDNEMDLLADPEIDAVYIASPVACHANQAMMAADAGKHILIEKPLALTSEEGEKVIRYCEAKGVQIAVGLMMRFGTHVQEMKKAIAENKIGRVVSGYVQFTCWYPEMSGNWRQSKKYGGGGCLMDMGVHCIDLMQYITGSRVKEVMAMNDNLSFQYEVEDTSSVLMRMENGCQCVLQSNFNIPDAAAKWRLELFGEQGRLLGDNVIGQIDGGHLDVMYLEKQGNYNAQQDTNDINEALSTDKVDEFGDLYAKEIKSFSNSILKGIPLEVPASEAVYLQKVIEAAYASGESGCIESVKK